MKINEEDKRDLESGLSSNGASTKTTKKEQTEDGEGPASHTSKPSLWKVVMMARPEIPMMFVAFICLALAEASNLVLPIILSEAYDSIIAVRDMGPVNKIMTNVIIIYFSGAFIGFLRTLIQGIIGERLVARLRCKLYSAILKQEIAFFDEHKVGELVSRLGSDTTLLQLAISFSIPEVLGGLIRTIVAVILMFYLSVKLALISLGGVVFIFLLCIPFGIKLGKLSKDYQDELGAAQTHSTEALGSMRTVQSFAAEKKEQDRFERKIGNPDHYPLWWPTMRGGDDTSSTYSVGFFKSWVNSGFFTLIFGGGFGFLYISLWYGFYQVSLGELTIGQLTAFQSYVFNIGFGLGQVGGNAAKVYEALGASGRIFYLLDRIPSIPKPAPSQEKHLTPTKMEGNIEFQNVTFAYPTRDETNVLENVSLKIESGQTLALVGSSGSGKSTALSLLQRFYDLKQGSITIDNIDITDLNLQWLRSKIGYVQQEPDLFGLSIRDNLVYGVNRSVSQQELESVCREANAHDFISDMSDGYDTLVGERGVKVSGGQKQRIAIARALLANCSILLFDEATSALDAESEHLVQQAIDKAVVGRTVVIVAHRLSTIRAADQIAVMDNHRVVDVGTHEYLLENCVKYQDLIERQNMK
eukprot:CAMPEP_0203670868 /NCGR_PEP_ID=MMETSP0090-20130426/6828_1 /ASSEMBLY_ACC=CAM_ASM_001088 /TAXON_ID=426623 /ORGANISM="Chaetoceros affinis, Strain CCMP159" /LENGTH=640 /DNA_ID=CAMNT_0050535839 /DNA_START=51 /DNA_END=1973 /DNA_ORIENTATION=-